MRKLYVKYCNDYNISFHCAVNCVGTRVFHKSPIEF